MTSAPFRRLRFGSRNPKTEDRPSNERLLRGICRISAFLGWVGFVDYVWCYVFCSPHSRQWELCEPLKMTNIIFIMLRNIYYKLFTILYQLNLRTSVPVFYRTNVVQQWNNVFNEQHITVCNVLCVNSAAVFDVCPTLPIWPEGVISRQAVSDSTPGWVGRRPRSNIINIIHLYI